MILEKIEEYRSRIEAEKVVAARELDEQRALVRTQIEGVLPAICWHLGLAQDGRFEDTKIEFIREDAAIRKIFFTFVPFAESERHPPRMEFSWDRYTSSNFSAIYTRGARIATVESTGDGSIDPESGVKITVDIAQLYYQIEYVVKTARAAQKEVQNEDA